MNTDNGILGPTHFEGVTVNFENPKELLEYEWRRQLKSVTGQTKFKIKFYGQYHPEYTELIMGSEAPLLAFAITLNTNEEILLFDGCEFGYDNIFWQTHSEDEKNNRPLSQFYKNKNNQDIFEIFISTYDTLEYEDYKDDIDENGFIEVKNEKKIPFEIVKRNAFDSFQVVVRDSQGMESNAIQEELA